MDKLCMLQAFWARMLSAPTASATGLPLKKLAQVLRHILHRAACDITSSTAERRADAAVHHVGANAQPGTGCQHAEPWQQRPPAAEC